MKHLLYLAIYPLFFLTLVSAIVKAQAPKIVRGPYLQVLTPTSVIVRWRTDQPTASRVWFGESVTQLTGTVRDAETTLEHKITITGLQPATQYTYAVGFDETQLAAGPDYYVKTALPAGSTGPVRLWVLGDFGSGTPNQRNVYQAYLNATATHPADLWLWLGDNAYSYGREDEFQANVFNVYPTTFRNTPLFISPGNHDYADQRTNLNIAYYSLFSFPEKGESGGVASNSKSYYSADYGNIHLISLDSQAELDGGARLYDTTGTQVQWLKRDLEANRKSTTTPTWTMVIFHHPPYSKTSHDSDTEEQMKLLRENLTPIFERYGVDLVLNGHSHGYERTYRMKGMRGLANTFDPAKHIVENTSSRYDGSPNSCPIMTKGEGTVYIVNGSGGQLGGKSPGYPLPAAVYSTVELSGSLIMDINENRLDAQLVLSDGSVGDKFTMMKAVNKTTPLNALYGDTLQLSASWLGEHQWSDGQTNRAIRYAVNKSGAYPVSVKDNQNCLTDVFQLTVPKPKLTAKTSSSACAGSSVAVNATLENIRNGAGLQYDVLLSDASGNFTNEQIVGSGSLTDLKVTIPATAVAGSTYRVRVRPRGLTDADLVPSEPIALKSTPTATLTGSTTLAQGDAFSLSIAFTGDGPWTGTLSDGTMFSGTLNPTILTLKATKSIVYSISSVENACGKGVGSGQASVIVLLPTGDEDFAGGHLRVYPNPAHDMVHVELTTTQKKDVLLNLIDAQGRSVFQRQAGQLTSLTEAIHLPHATGTYLLQIQVGEQTLTRKIVQQ